MKEFTVKKRHLLGATLALVGCLCIQPVSASPFGAGVFGADVPFGSETSISIALSNNVDMEPASIGGGLFSGTGSHQVTVTSTDVVGYDLYVNATASTALSNGIDSIPASGNVTAATLSTNTWGYNTVGSTTNYVGISGTQKLINSGIGPFKSGVDTDMTYGTLINTTKSSGVYSAGVTYTAVGRS